MKVVRISLGIMHYYLIKIWNWNRFNSNKICIFSWRSVVRIEKNGTIGLNGKLALSDFCELRAIGHIQVGKNVFVNKFSRIISHKSIEIGNNVLIAQFVSILDHDHKYSYQNNEIQFDGYNVDAIKIGNNVLIGDKVTILKGTVIGDNVIIGANSLVKGIIPSNSMVVSTLATTQVSTLNRQ